MPMAKKWFKKAVKKRPPNTLGGWKKNLPAKVRRDKAYKSRPKSWSAERKLLSAARALIALANVTQDIETKKAARADATFFLVLRKKLLRRPK